MKANPQGDTLQVGIRVPAWGATWLLPKKYRIAWGARGIADKAYNRLRTHVVSLLPDRQSAVGDMDRWQELKGWIEKNLLPLYLNYDGKSEKVEEIDDGKFHARWTPNGSFGYVYLIAWED